MSNRARKTVPVSVATGRQRGLLTLRVPQAAVVVVAGLIVVRGPRLPPGTSGLLRRGARCAERRRRLWADRWQCWRARLARGSCCASELVAPQLPNQLLQLPAAGRGGL